MTDNTDDLDEDWAAAIKEIAAQSPAPEDQSAATGKAAAGASAKKARGGQPAGKQKPAVTTPSNFEDFGAASSAPGTSNDFDLILDIPVQISVELGRKKLPIRQLLQLVPGTVVELEGKVGDPIDVLVNGTLIARGEVVVVNDKLGVRLTDIISPAERIQRLRS